MKRFNEDHIELLSDLGEAIDTMDKSFYMCLGCDQAVIDEDEKAIYIKDSSYLDRIKLNRGGLTDLDLTSFAVNVV